MEKILARVFFVALSKMRLRCWARRDHSGIWRRSKGGRPISSKIAEIIPQIPASYTKTCAADPKSRGKIKATAVDGSGKLQYFYSPDYRKHKNAIKFDRVRQLIDKMPSIRAQLRVDLDSPKPSVQMRAIAITMMDKFGLRPGKVRYARNGTYGASTLRRRHFRMLSGGGIGLQFKGKKKIDQSFVIRDPYLQKSIQRAFRQIPDAFVTRHVDVHHPRALPKPFQLKDLRTLAVNRMLIKEMGRGANCSQALERVARRVGHTTKTCKVAYVAPKLWKAMKRKRMDWPTITSKRQAEDILQNILRN